MILRTPLEKCKRCRVIAFIDNMGKTSEFLTRLIVEAILFLKLISKSGKKLTASSNAKTAMQDLY